MLFLLICLGCSSLAVLGLKLTILYVPGVREQAAVGERSCGCFTFVCCSVDFLFHSCTLSLSIIHHSLVQVSSCTECLEQVPLQDTQTDTPNEVSTSVLVPFPTRCLLVSTLPLNTLGTWLKRLMVHCCVCFIHMFTCGCTCLN